MHIRWRGLELPSRVIRDESVSNDSYARIIAEPFEHGFGTTIGNSLRRILLSSLEGAAITSVKIDGVAHEFCAMDGVLEDVTDILLNMKGIVVALEGDEPKTMKVHREGAGDITAGDIEADAAITVINPEHHIATLTDEVTFHAEFTVARGRGYVTATENRKSEHELGVIPLDSIFSPVIRVRYRTEAMRVGQRTNYDRLIMEIWTRGSLSPEDALVEAGSILRKHINPFVMMSEIGDDVVSPSRTVPAVQSPADDALQELLTKPVSMLELSVRAKNCLEQARISTMRELVEKTESDLLRVRSFGKTSLHEVQRKLSEHGLVLGIRFDETGQPIMPPPSSHVDEAADDEDEEGGEEPSDMDQMQAFTMGD